jgi:poly-beta-1,6-N-acetyl-D-glucosamine N-deacetylase
MTHFAFIKQKYFVEPTLTSLAWLAFVVLSMLTPVSFAKDQLPAQSFQVLSYHDIRDNVDADLDQESTALSTKHLARHFAWLQAHGYHPISVDDILNAQAGKKPLPAKAILLTFDDGYQSVYSRVYPLLKLYKYPAVAALVGSWLEVPADGKVQYGDEQVPRSHFLTAAQINEMADSGLVEFASHSFDLHHGVLGNPQGNNMPAATTRKYDQVLKTYESDASYNARLTADLRINNALITKLTGKAPRVMVWPYGAHNAESRDIAKALNMPINLTLDELDISNTQSVEIVGRYLIEGNPNESKLNALLNERTQLQKQRVMHLDLDYVYDADAVQMAKNLDALLDRVKSLAPSTVYLQAFADPNGDGVAEAVYFPNRHVDMRADLFSRVAWQLRTRAGVKVYAWMPVLAFELKDKQKQQALQVVSTNAQADNKLYKRLSPFSGEAKTIISEIYADLGKHAKFDGVIFHDDVTLSESEDYSTFALEVYAQQFKSALIEKPLTEHESIQFGIFKSQYLTQFTLDLAAILKRYQPNLKTARNLYAPVMLSNAPQRWLAQNYTDFLDSYDYTAVMAMPLMEQVAQPEAWLTSLVKAAAERKNGLQKTIFELQATDWRKQKPLNSAQLISHFKTLDKAGALHVGYYPDDFIRNLPDREQIRPYISARDFPYLHE